MSSPLSTLKKLKRTPLQQWEQPDHHPRRNLAKEFQAAAEQGSSISDPNPHVTHKDPQKIKMTPKKDSPQSRPEPTTSSVIQQLSCLEHRVRAQEEQIQLKSFLLDYDMIWVGSDTTDAKESEQAFNFKELWTPPETNSGDRQFHVNFDLVLEKIQELNVVAGEGETYIQTTPTGAQLAQKEAVELWLYRNGILMFDGAFRTYREQKTQQFMQDLMDGYFPSELQERFPDGVPFEVHDRRHELLSPKQERNTFPGHGHVIQGNNGKSTVSLNAILDVVSRKLGHGVKAGQVMTSGEDLERALQVTMNTQGSSDARSSNSVIFVDTPALHSLKVKSGCEASDVTTLKIKSEDGRHTYMMKMSFSETIGHIRKHLDKHRGGDVPSYDIIGTFPRCCYDDSSKTIQACGLAANSALLLRTRPARNEAAGIDEKCINKTKAA
ncbi:hypothetical protein WMY93_008559 [Mugilogobius chulae]|uniref:UBX domain-containing protein 11 n=1 Tax=Mugilogobius chulae TaxID=88201 RepID=A0AAW0PVG7_9GOBI